MKFAAIISGAGFDPKKYPHLSEIPITVYDRKSRVINVANFAYPLFSKNLDSLNKFKKFLEENENGSITSMDVKLHEGFIAIFTNTSCKANIFMRV